ncbi:hypothetical protein [Actinoplanes sp. L3-i22]|uniref:hypothetical protein n=1 Tax=Actinoplanes sp. L3-i22 TaxID=2836373 RepID=UPI001C78FF54|nr:hypothetical protein [Actinoplanes sp. L3-i22]BCY15490.1 hypothetical protein L3i22_105780 [Actinoplanes sp. L3-i22]
MADVDDVRRELGRQTGAARVPHLQELARIQTDRYWRAGTGQARALPELTEAIGALDEAYRWFAPGDSLRAPVAAQLGTLLAARYIGHSGPDSDRDNGIALLTEALASPRLPFGPGVLARLMLGQLQMRVALGSVRTGGVLPALRPGGGPQVEAARAAAGCFREVLAGPELSPQVTTVTRTMLAIAEGFVEAFRGVGMNVGAVSRAARNFQQAQKQWRDLGMGSLFTAGTRLARTDPLDRPVLLIEGDDEPAQEPAKPEDRPATRSADPRRELQKLFRYEEAGALLAHPDVAFADELVALATAVLHGDDARPADHLPLALGLTLRARADRGPGADDDTTDARDSLRAAAASDLPPDAFPLLLRLSQALDEPCVPDVTAALRTVGADALAVPQPDGTLLLHAATGRVVLGTGRSLPRRTLIVTDRPPAGTGSIVSSLAGHRQLLDLARRKRRPIIAEPVLLAGPDLARAEELRRCYGRGELLARATPADVLDRLGATVLHLDCPAGPTGGLLLAGPAELTAAMVADARIRRGGGLVVLPPGVAFPQLADAFLTAGLAGAIGWLHPVEQPAEVYRELHRRLGVERQEPAAAVQAVRRQLRDAARGLVHRGVY